MVRPVTMTGLVVFWPVKPPGLQVAVYVAMAAPPSLPVLSGVKAMEACWFAGVAAPIAGALGATALMVTVEACGVAAP